MGKFLLLKITITKTLLPNATIRVNISVRLVLLLAPQARGEQIPQSY